MISIGMLNPSSFTVLVLASLHSPANSSAAREGLLEALGLTLNPESLGLVQWKGGSVH